MLTLSAESAPTILERANRRAAEREDFAPLIEVAELLYEEAERLGAYAPATLVLDQVWPPFRPYVAGRLGWAI